MGAPPFTSFREGWDSNIRSGIGCLKVWVSRPGIFYRQIETRSTMAARFPEISAENQRPKCCAFDCS
jgi:hypothetical protein